MNTKLLKKVAMFRTGDYGEKGRYDEADLDLMAASYDPDYLEGPVTRDHIDYGPADGWIEKIYRIGDTLFGDWAVHPETYDMLKEGRYKRRSIEFYRKHTMPDGSTVPYVKACSILGAATPHCKGMPNISFSTFSGHEPTQQIAFEEKSESVTATQNNDSELHRRIANAVESLAAKFLEQGFATDSRDAFNLAEAEIARCGFECLRDQLGLRTQQDKSSRVEAYHNRRDEIAEKVIRLQQDNPTKDYLEVCLEAERAVLS